MNLTDLRNHISKELGLDNTTTGDQGLIDDYVNQGVNDVLVKTRCKVSSATMTLTAGTSDYTLDTAILATIDLYVTSNNNVFYFQRVSVPEILEMRRASSDTNSPSRFYAVAGSSTLMVYPTPSAADVITIYYVPRPATLTSGTDTPSDIPTEWHRLVEFYGMWRMASYDDDQSSGQGERYKNLYEEGLKDFRKANLFKGGVRMAPGRVGRRRSQRVPYRNDVDY